QCDQLLPHADALVYTNRHNLPAEVAVKMSNTDLYNLVEGQELRPENFNPRYADGLLQIKVPGGLNRAGERRTSSTRWFASSRSRSMRFRACGRRWALRPRVP